MRRTTAGARPAASEAGRGGTRRGAAGRALAGRRVGRQPSWLGPAPRRAVGGLAQNGGRGVSAAAGGGAGVRSAAVVTEGPLEGRRAPATENTRKCWWGLLCCGTVPPVTT